MRILFVMKIIKRLLLLFLLLGCLLGAIGLGYYFAVTKNTDLQPQKLTLHEKHLLLYDKNGEVIENVSAFPIQQTITIDELPKYTVRAFIDTEDKRFFTHHGFDLKRIAKASWNNLRAHAFKEGASTISQQLIKNTHLSQEKTIQRKLKEWKLTRLLEKSYSKEEILEKYLNSIYFGHNCFGLCTATEFYFSKPPSELTLGESAILAGLIKSPNNYSPFNNPQNCEKRKESVLYGMYKNGSINENERKTALQEALPVFSKKNEKNHGYLTFVFDELSALAEKYKLPMGGNIEIYTGMDPALQTALEEIANTCKDCDKTLLSLDTTTGDFKGCVSSVGNIYRLPGSLIKPLLSYAPAFEENILVPATPILDEKIDFSGYTPENHDGKFHGYVSARECIAKSLNIPAVKTLQTLGIKKGVKYLEKLGLEVEEDDQSLALALGGMKKGFTLKSLASAYSVFPNGGVLKNSGFIKEIKINKQLVFSRPTNKNRVFSEETAYLMTDTLQSTTDFGTAKKLRALPFEISAKTGTVGTKKGNTDAYALSYTSRDLVAVWLGNADNSFIEDMGGGTPCSMLLKANEYLQKDHLSKKENIPPFTMPRNIRKIALDKTSYYDTHTIMLADELSPMEYRFEELFKKDCLPTKKSSFFSNPAILPPTLSLEENGVRIVLQKNTPPLYSFSIDRYDYATHKTIYQGKFKESFFDDSIEPSKTYLYTITPYYMDVKGNPITLPAVHTLEKSSSPPPIVEKEWWNY